LCSQTKMSLFWTITAVCLYTEAGVITLLLMPFISSKIWNSVFKSRIVSRLSSYASFYFNGCLVILGMMVFEAVRQVRYQNHVYQELKSDPSIYKPETESVYLMKLFRAQRNLYISGFCLYLWFVFKRLVTLIADHARVTAAGEASLAQARSATEAARRLMTNTEGDREDSSDHESDALRDEIDALKAKLDTEVTARKSAETQMEVIKKQAEQVSKEYDRVSAECQQLQKELAAVTGDDRDKKKD
uniref:Endoplasmic reticulum transmembrane protein n=1 Tax=Taenia asiatica TaxID=60517 RepID=A0A0R3W8C7_TAEAS